MFSSELDVPRAPVLPEHVCGDCHTDDEIEQQLGPVVAFVLSVVIAKLAKGDDRYKMMIPALETVRCQYIVLNNNADEKNRGAAIRALGLGD